MAKNLPAWVFLGIALLVIGMAQLPLLRFAIGVDDSISMPFTTTVVLMIGGLMSGLTAMLLLVKRAPAIQHSNDQENLSHHKQLVAIHCCGLLMYTGIPLLNFLAAYWFWGRARHRNKIIDLAGRDVLNFQITIYLYLLLSLFMVFAAIGIITTPIILLLHLVATMFAILFTILGKSFNYPANIPIIQGRR